MSDCGKLSFVASEKKLDSDKGRRGGMADAADSKSVNGNIVRVQVPPPAYGTPHPALCATFPSRGRLKLSQEAETFFIHFIGKNYQKSIYRINKIGKSANNSFQI